MRKLLLLIVIAFGTNSFAQTITKKGIDKFTKAEIIETSQVSLYSETYGTGWVYKLELFFRRTDGAFSMPARILMKDIVKYTEDDGIMFLLDNDETVTLKTLYTGVGGEAEFKGYVFSTSFLLTDDNVEMLKNHKVVAVRINYMGGHYDKDLKGKKQELIMRSLKLFDK